MIKKQETQMSFVQINYNLINVLNKLQLNERISHKNILSQIQQYFHICQTITGFDKLQKQK